MKRKIQTMKRKIQTMKRKTIVIKGEETVGRCRDALGLMARPFQILFAVAPFGHSLRERP